jgi:hypothetical protein
LQQHSKTQKFNQSSTIRWTLWYDNPGRKASKETWSEQLKPLATFGFVEDFWAAFNNLRPASALSAGSNYHLFKGFID